MPDLMTCSFQKFPVGVGLPVRTTVGSPRFQLPYRLVTEFRLLTPRREWLGLSKAAYQRNYIGMLEAHGVDKLTRAFDALAEAHGVDTLVFLCFDNLAKPGPDAWCHRTMFGAWWESVTGAPVPELAGPKRPAATHSQDPLL